MTTAKSFHPSRLVIQYGWKGRWYELTGRRSPDEDLASVVERMNAREGYRRFRVADASTEGEEGAPLPPVHDPAPLPPEVVPEFLKLVDKKCKAGLSDMEQARLTQILDINKHARLSTAARQIVEDIRCKGSMPADDESR